MGGYSSVTINRVLHYTGYHLMKYHNQNFKNYLEKGEMRGHLIICHVKAYKNKCLHVMAAIDGFILDAQGKKTYLILFWMLKVKRLILFLIMMTWSSSSNDTNAEKHIT